MIMVNFTLIKYYFDKSYVVDKPLFLKYGVFAPLKRVTRRLKNPTFLRICFWSRMWPLSYQVITFFF